MGEHKTTCAYGGMGKGRGEGRGWGKRTLMAGRSTSRRLSFLGFFPFFFPEGSAFEDPHPMSRPRLRQRESRRAAATRPRAIFRSQRSNSQVSSRLISIIFIETKLKLLNQHVLR